MSADERSPSALAAMVTGLAAGTGAAAWLARRLVRDTAIEALTLRVQSLEATVELALDPVAQEQVAKGMADLAHGEFVDEAEVWEMLRQRRLGTLAS